MRRARGTVESPGNKMAEPAFGPAAGVHRPRNVDWKRAAALLYGDWGTSKAYVIGLAFVAAGFSSFPIILAVCALTAIVGYNYIIVCSHFPDGGGVYSAARKQSRFLASAGALLLVANFIVTAALSGWAAVSYLGISSENARLATAGLILVVGIINYFGPRHSGSVSIWLAVPAVLVVILIVAFSGPHLKVAELEPAHSNFAVTWIQFVGVILALSGVEAVANLTGVMKLDPDSSPERPKVARTATKAIVPVAIEVVFGTALLGWAMLSLPKFFAPQLADHKEDMLRFLAEHYGAVAIAPWFGTAFGIAVGIVFGLLLFSAVNTAVVAMIGVVFMMAQDGEMPRQLARLNRHGVPQLPLLAAVALPILVLALTSDVVFCLQRFGNRADAAFLFPQTLWSNDPHGNAQDRRNGRPEFAHHDAAAPGRGAKDHGRRPRNQSRAQFCPRRSATTQGGSLCRVREGSCRLFFRSTRCRWPAEMAGRSRGERHYVVDAKRGTAARCMRAAGICRERGCSRYDCRSFRDYGRRLSGYRNYPTRRPDEFASRQRGKSHRGEFARLDSFGHLRLITNPVFIARRIS